MNLSVHSLEEVGIPPGQAISLPEGVKRQLARFLLRWRRPDLALPLLPERDQGPRDRFDRCRVLLAAGEVEAARNLARELVNMPDAGPWGHRAVGEVFLALEKPDRADERFRAGSDPVGRARAHLLLEKPSGALDLLRHATPDDPEAEVVRLEALRLLGQETASAEAGLRELLEEERQELREALDESTLLWPGSPDGDSSAPLDEEGLKAALQRVFGYAEFRPGQLRVIQPLMEGESVQGLMPTGAGKSLCFQLPAALVPGATVVISPLIALMKDQVEGLPPRLYRRATLVNSSLDPGEAERRLEMIASGEVSLIYAAPERLRQRPFVRALQRRGVSLFVVDEAHCVSLWGHDFRPDYLFIRRVLQDLGRPRVLALTATATPEMQADIGRQLDTPLRNVNLGTFRPNLRFEVRKVPSEPDKWAALLDVLREEKGPAIVYVDRRKIAEELAEKLREEGITAEAYHAGLEKGSRDRAQSRFMLGEVRVICATVAFGMGVDKADVRVVAHYHLPRSLESYYQEAGRAGRDGLPARCLLLYTSYDKSNLTRRVNSDRLQAREVLAVYRCLARWCKMRPGAIAAEDLEQDCGADGTRVRVAISLLQRLGVLDRGYDLPATVWIARGAAGGGVPGGMAPECSGFLEAAGLGARGAMTLPAAQAAAAAGLELEELEPALLDWQEAGWIRYRANGRGLGVRLSPSGADLEREIHQMVERGVEMDRIRLEQLNRFLQTVECRQLFVGRYFGGQRDEGCGVCDNCGRQAAGPVRVARDRSESAGSTWAPGADGPVSDEESALFERLRAWRREKAREEGLPAYVIFHDRVLYTIARLRPKTLPALAEIPGVGRTKLQTYGPEVLSVVRE